MNKVKIYRIVEFVKSCGAFPHDTDDVIEGMQDILTEYGIYSILADDEYYSLLDELLEMAEQSEISEAELWSKTQLLCGVDSQWASDYRLPGVI
jgi:hypothetical protein